MPTQRSQDALGLASLLTPEQQQQQQQQQRLSVTAQKEQMLSSPKLLGMG
jgi:hypothetical protein